MPRQKVAPNDIKKRWPHLKDIPLETSDKEISVLLGADLPQLHISYDVRVGENDHPVGMLTKLGWVLLGGKADKGKTNVTLNHVKTHGLQKLVQKFWKIESYATLPKNDIKLLPKKDAHAMKILQTTTSKVQNRYSVGLLWKEQLPELPNNRCLASSRMLSLEKKFEKSPSLKEKYVQTINEYIKDGHTSILSKAEAEKESTKIISYTPHQAVTNINKPGKICVIFDASTRYKNTSKMIHLVEHFFYICHHAVSPFSEA